MDTRRPSILTRVRHVDPIPNHEIQNMGRLVDKDADTRRVSVHNQVSLLGKRRA